MDTSPIIEPDKLPASTGNLKSNRNSTDHLESIAPSEWIFVAVSILLTLIITTLPYIYGYLSSPPDKQFMGIMLDTPDHIQYFSWMRELSVSNLSANKLTPETNPPIFFNLLWWMMGRIGKWLNIGFAGMLQILRIISTSLFLIVTYRLSSWFFSDIARRRTSFLIVLLTSGFGWVLILLKYTVMSGESIYPLDIYTAEGNTFLGILGYPHFITAALYIFIFDLILRGERRDNYGYAVAAGLFALFLGWQHAYDLISIYGILGAYGALRLFRERRLPRYLTIGGLIILIISCWPALYSIYLTSVDPLWKQVLEQFANAGVYTPSPLHLPILLGPAFILALYTSLRSNPLQLRDKDSKDLFILGWFFITFLLIYLPVDYQIHLLNGWQVPIAIFATKGLFDYIIPWIKDAIQKSDLRISIISIERAVVAVFILLILPTNIYLWAWRFVELSRADYPYFLYEDELNALAWLDENADPNDVVLSSLTIGQYIPALTGSHAFLAHWAQTVDFFTKRDMVEDFYNADKTDQDRINTLEEFSVDYIFHGPVEKEMGKYSPQEAKFLLKVFSSGSVDLYKISPAP